MPSRFVRAFRRLRAVAACMCLATPIPAIAASGMPPTAAALLPVPSGPVQAGTGWLPYRGRLSAHWTGQHGPDLDAAVRRFAHDLRRLAGSSGPGRQAMPLRIECCRTRAELDPAGLGQQAESYDLVVTSEGATIRARSGLGVLHALATLRQLLQTHAGAWALPALSLHDAPRFGWRGVMIDTARHFMRLSTLERQIDAMAKVKLDVLHLHLSDNEGFRVQSLRYPALTAHEHGRFYTQEQIRALVRYAARRGIRIVPEFDLPGHAAAITRAYPQLAPGNAAGSEVLDVTDPRTRRFVRGLLTEMAALFPDPVFHAGGDEVKGALWTADASISAYMRAHDLADAAALQGRFMRHVQHLLEGLGKTMIGWEEITGDKLPDAVIVQAWNSSNAVYAATAKGHPVVVSAGYYLDYLEPAAVYYRRDPLDATAAGVSPSIYAKVRKIGNPRLSAVFPESHVIRPGLTLSAAQKRRVIGAEAPLWSELVTDEMLDARLWPRMAALAERFWSAAAVRDVDSLQRRLITVQAELERLGLEAHANRWRMAARLAPQHPGVVLHLADLTTPVRHFAHMHKLLAYVHKQPFKGQTFRSLADIATPSNPVALSFNLAARRFAAGDHDAAAPLRARLRGWQDNDARYQALAASHPALRAAAPVSADTARLAAIGIHAMDLLQSDQKASAAWRRQARKLIARLQGQQQASASLFATIVSPTQPPADLLVAVLPGIQALVAAVSH